MPKPGSWKSGEENILEKIHMIKIKVTLNSYKARSSKYNRRRNSFRYTFMENE